MNVQGGDRGHVAVNVPSSVVPYAPVYAPTQNDINDRGLVSDSSIWQKFQRNSNRRVSNPNSKTSEVNVQTTFSYNPSLDHLDMALTEQNSFLRNDNLKHKPSDYVNNGNQKTPIRQTSSQASTADFSAFKDTNMQPKLKVEGDDYSYDEGYHETDRIDIPSLIDPNALIYSSNSAPYGQQYPSYVPHSIETLMGSSLNTKKHLSAGNNVVYGRGKIAVPENTTEDANTLLSSSASSGRKNVFMTNSKSFEKDTEESEYDYDYSEYDDEYNEFEEGGENYEDEMYNDKYLESLNKKLQLVDEILNRSSPDNNMLQGEKDDLLPDLVKLWNESKKREPKTDLNG